MIISHPYTSRIFIISSVARASPPSCPRFAQLLIKTFSSVNCFFMRIRSPKIAPPVRGLVGSTQIMPTFFPCSVNKLVKVDINVDFPLPGAPVMPKMYALPVYLYIFLMITSAAVISFSAIVIKRAAALISPFSKRSINSS